MAYRPIHHYGGNESDGQTVENCGTGGGGWSGILGDVDDFIFYYSGENDDGDSGEYRSTR